MEAFFRAQIHTGYTIHKAYDYQVLEIHIAQDIQQPKWQVDKLR